MLAVIFFHLVLLQDKTMSRTIFKWTSVCLFYYFGLFFDHALMLWEIIEHLAIIIVIAVSEFVGVVHFNKLIVIIFNNFKERPWHIVSSRLIKPVLLDLNLLLLASPLNNITFFIFRGFDFYWVFLTLLVLNWRFFIYLMPIPLKQWRNHHLLWIYIEVVFSAGTCPCRNCLIFEAETCGFLLGWLILQDSRKLFENIPNYL